MQDFAMVDSIVFPSEGSNLTPAHHFSDFKFKAYAPVAFRYFRDLFGIQPDGFLLSLCNEPMIELGNPGASGSIFFVTKDDEFILKTVQHKEAEFLQNLLPGYYMNLNQNPRTLLPKFYGLYCYQCGGKNVRVIVMNNLLPRTFKMHQKYDLKGSTYKRKASKHERQKSSPTFKDLDFMEHYPDGICLEAETYNALVKTIQRDCRVLESFKIMDYSLLVGVHNLDEAMRDNEQQRISDGENNAPIVIPAPSPSTSARQRPTLERSKSLNRQRLAAFSTAMESIQADGVFQLPDDVPAGGIPAKNAKGERILLFVGIIDILQSYRLKKKLEHSWKSLFHDGDAVSVHRPGFYASRFQDFMAKRVFRKQPTNKTSPPKRRGTGPMGSASGEMSYRMPLNAIPDEPEPNGGGADGPPATAANNNSGSQAPPPADGRVGGVVNMGGGGGKRRSSTEPSQYGPPSGAEFCATTAYAHSEISLSSSSTSGVGSSSIRRHSYNNRHNTFATSSPSMGGTLSHTEGTPSLTESSDSGDIFSAPAPISHPPMPTKRVIIFEKETTEIIGDSDVQVRL